MANDAFEDDTATNGHRDARPGRWVAEGGRLRWIPASDATAEDDDVGPDDALAALDEDQWASDTPSLPSGAPESARVRSALAWLARQRQNAATRIGELALEEHDHQQAAEAAPRRRQRGPSESAVAISHLQGAEEWYGEAESLLREQADRTPGRALVEWYLAVQATPDRAPAAPDDPLGAAHVAGYTEASQRTRQHAERLTLPEID